MTASLPAVYGLLVASALFLLGLMGLLLRRDLIFMLLSLEIMFNAAGLAFVSAAARWGQADGQVMFLFVLTVSGAEAAVGLALILRIHHVFKTLDADELRRLRG